VAHYAIGDLQGCHAEFMALLERLAFDPARDRLWLTGDLVNRGPDSLAVLREVKSLGRAVTVVLGNHDLHLLALAFAPRTVRRSEPELVAVLEAEDAGELLDWLAARPLLHRDDALGWTLIHAGLPPQWTLALAESCAREVERALRSDAAAMLADMYGDAPDRWSEDLSGADRLRFTVNCFTRLRFVDRKGRLLLAYKGSVADAPAGSIPWFRHPERATRGDALVFGHWSALGFVAEPGLRGLDTGCVWGGALTAIRLDRNDMQPVRLPCRRRAPR
jgi:bis(5'-nucleosyl)-tetraphosphatase (symmetrical)